MSVHWSHQNALLVLLTCLLHHHFTGGELTCGSAIGKYDCNQVDNDYICKDEPQPPVCPQVASLSLPTTGSLCSYQAARNSTTHAQLSLMPVAHNCVEYNLTVSWTFNTTIETGSIYELRLLNENGHPHRTICSQQLNGSAVWTHGSFDGLAITGTPFSVVELAVLAANKSVLLVMKTEVANFLSFYELLPVSPYRCRLEDMYRTSPVTNLSHTLSNLEEGTYRVELTWEPPTPVAQYMIPVTYYVTLITGSNSTTVHTNQTQLVIYSLEPTREHSIKVEPFVPCSLTCGSSENRTIPGAPSISHIVTLSSTTIEIKWNEIPESGIISEYEVRYKVLNESMFCSVSTRNLSVLLSDLKASTTYEASIRAYTSVGPSPFGMAVTIQTMDIATSDIPIVTVTNQGIATSDIPIVASVSASVVVVVVVGVSFCVVLFIAVLVFNRRKRSTVEVESCRYSRDNSPQPGVSPSPSATTFCCDKESSPDSSSEHSFQISDLSQNSSLKEVEALVVVSKRCLNKRLLDILVLITRYRHNETIINLTFMGDETTHGKIAQDVLEEALSRSKELYLLCVVNKEFLEEWKGGKEVDSLVFCLRERIRGKINVSKRVERTVVLYEQEDYRKYLPNNLEQYKAFRIEDTMDISRLIAGQPEFII